jgi:hypothetical protein
LISFALPVEGCRLLAQIESLENGVVEKIVVHSGIPRRVVLRGRLPEVRTWIDPPYPVAGQRLMEIDPKYADCIIRRYQDYTGKPAVLEGDGRTFDQIAGERLKEAAWIARCRREIAVIEAQLLAGHPDVQGLCMALSDWSQELRLLLAAQTKKSRRGGTPAANASPIGGDQPLME